MFALVALLRPAGGLVARVLPAAALVLAAAAVLLVYAEPSPRDGLLRLHRRPRLGAVRAAAPFADCSAFTPPAGTRALCEKSDARTRQGPDHYMWDGDSPAMGVVGERGRRRRTSSMGRLGAPRCSGSPRPTRAR